MSGHTPGPWQVGDCDQGRNIIVTEDGAELLGVDPGDWDREAFVVGEDADLLLMAAAPDLLEALEMVRDADEDCKRDGLPTLPGPARKRIDAALAKARGES